ncbi:MAG: recombination protein RecR [Lentisphaeria bacterium]|nr:recombination protein RecR [Lentisphaeria bacterium]
MSESTSHPIALQRLISHLRRLPGVGVRSAERMALAMLDWPDDVLATFSREVGALRENVRSCTICGNLSDTEFCLVCRANDRRRDIICVVETVSQIIVLEKTGGYRGLYHVLGGRLAPLEGHGPEDLRIAELRARLTDGTVKELILATSSDVEGEATAHFVAAEFADSPVLVTRIASGVPVGADLSYADPATLIMALGGRRELGR